ncbi:MAG: aminodeoxychorismate/anthranilate synthase component II [Saprospiraceae bacterium]|nr:aminodeoxychorismate/anthranilate synthase component II [Saprospiraceae bacterium]
MRILVLDNYDSFTYNLVQYLRELSKHPVEVHRNDAISIEAVAAYDLIVLSPGPGVPSEAGNMPAIIQAYKSEKPILGICLGHQAIGEAFGGILENLSDVYHGVSTPMHLEEGTDDPIFAGVDDTFEAGRYHSWVIRQDSLPAELTCLARDAKGEIMAIRHKEYPIWGLQFHPESVLTPVGKTLLSNFLATCDELVTARATN